jgi:predicted DNA-binding transcriptional regulator AlpA
MNTSTSKQFSGVEAALVDAATAAQICDVSRSKWWSMFSAGRTPRAIRTLGKRCPRWRRAELLAWIEAGCPDREAWEAAGASR